MESLNIHSPSIVNLAILFRQFGIPELGRLLSQVILPDSYKNLVSSCLWLGGNVEFPCAISFSTYYILFYFLLKELHTIESETSTFFFLITQYDKVQFRRRFRFTNSRCESLRNHLSYSCENNSKSQ